MEKFNQKEDKTRIGGFMQPPSENNDSSPGSSPSTSAPPPFSSPHDEEKSSPWSTPPPQHPPLSSQPQNSFPPPHDQDDMWLVVEASDRTFEYPLRDGETITVGRDSGQDVIITDKTLSRKHLVMQRNMDRISIQVLGLNGLVYANQIYKSTTLVVNAPCSLTVGKITCRLRKKIDTDATIMMNDPAAIARQRQDAGWSSSGGGKERPFQPSPAPSAPIWETSEKNPFDRPSHEDNLPFPGDQPIPPEFRTGTSEQAPPSPSPSHTTYNFAQSTFPGAGVRVEPVEKSGTGIKFNKNILLFGSLGFVIVAVAVTLFLLLREPSSGESEETTETTQVTEKSVPVQDPVAEKRLQREEDSLYGQYLDRAKRYFEEGETMNACDYLKDIPPASVYRSEAVDLAQRIPGCTL